MARGGGDRSLDMLHKSQLLLCRDMMRGRETVPVRSARSGANRMATWHARRKRIRTLA